MIKFYLDYDIFDVMFWFYNIFKSSMYYEWTYNLVDNIVY